MLLSTLLVARLKWLCLR